MVAVAFGTSYLVHVFSPRNPYSVASCLLFQHISLNVRKTRVLRRTGPDNSGSRKPCEEDVPDYFRNSLMVVGSYCGEFGAFWLSPLHLARLSIGSCWPVSDLVVVTIELGKSFH